MWRFLRGRLGQAALVLLVVSVFSFALLQMAPGDYYDRLRLNPRVRPQTVEALRRQSGEQQSAFIRYTRWLNSIARGDWGYSLVYQIPAAGLLASRLWSTLLLLALAIFIAVPASAVLAMLTALRGETKIEAFGFSVYRIGFETLTTILLAVPDTLLALLLLLLSLKIPAVRPLASGQIWLPLICLILSILPLYLVHAQSAITEAQRQPFIYAARANGIGRARLLRHYLLPAALNPMITLIGSSPSALLSSSLIVEGILGWPGFGQLLLESVRDRDIYVVADCSLIGSLLVVGGNLTADCLLLIADRRARYN